MLHEIVAALWISIRKLNKRPEKAIEKMITSERVWSYRFVVYVAPRSLSRDRRININKQNKTLNNHSKIISSNTHCARLISPESKTDYSYLP